MGWNETWVQGHDGRGPGWGSVVLWLGLLAVATVGLVAEYWDTNRGSAYFVIAVATAAWVWIFTSQRRKKSKPDHGD